MNILRWESIPNRPHCSKSPGPKPTEHTRNGKYFNVCEKQKRRGWMDRQSGLDLMQQPVCQLPGEAAGASSRTSSALSHRSCVCLPSSLVPDWLLGPLKSGQRASGTHNSHSEVRPQSGAQMAKELLGGAHQL